MKSAELKNQRLMEAFRKKSHEFREVIYQLLGYQVNSTSDNQYCLLNMYAESPEHKLLFRVGIITITDKWFLAKLVNWNFHSLEAVSR